MSKGQPTSGPRPKRPIVAVNELPWRDVEGGSGTASEDICGASRSLDLELDATIAGPTTCVLVPADGPVRVVSAGVVLGTVPTDPGEELLACMQNGWRYTGILTPLAARIAHLTIEGRRIE